MARSKTVESPSASAGLRKALLSVGADKGGVERLLSSKVLQEVVIPLYWKDGLVSSTRPLWLVKLPEFLKSFEKEFPDGQVRWDSDYEGDPASGDIALRVYFNYQEDDQGDHWSPPPTLLEEESYYRMLARSAFKGKKSVAASKVVHGK